MKRECQAAVLAILISLAAALLPLMAGAAAQPKPPGPLAGVKPATKAATTKPQRIEYAKGRQIAVLANKQIAESSGLACGWANKGVFWTHNDSGNKAEIYAFNAKGENLATCTITGAWARDWEDICSFRMGKEAVLLIGDIGDNGLRRLHCSLLVVHEPRLNLSRRNVKLRLKPAQTINYTYRGGPLNCEALAVDPTTRTIYLITKVLGGTCEAFALPWPKRPSSKPLGPPGGVIEIKPIAELKVPLVTAMDISPDGRRAVVLSYGSAYEYTRVGKETWGEVFARPGRALEMPPRRQGESICYGPDGKTLYLTSEKLPTPLLEVPPAGPAGDAKKQAAGGKDAT